MVVATVRSRGLYTRHAKHMRLTANAAHEPDGGTETTNGEYSVMIKRLVVATMVAALAAVGNVQAQEKASGAPTDAEIAMIVVTANTMDIAGGKLASKTSKNKEVKEFAETMVRDHGAVNQKATDLAKKLKLTPKESETSEKLEADVKGQLKKLKGLKGEEFDKAYVDHEVAYHTTVIEALDKTLIPNAKNEELKALLESGRPIFNSHLEHAKELQKSLNK